MHLNKPRFITFEGLDGCGKTTQIERFKHYLINNKGHKVTLTKEPGSTDLSKLLRKVLFTQLDNEKWCQNAELLMFFADRAQHIEKLILPALMNGSHVLCDRYIDSTYAYQTIQGIAEEKIKWLANLIDCLEPSITVLIDISPVVAHARAQAFRESGNHYDAKPVSFYESLREVYLGRACDNDRYCIINGNQSKDEVFEEIVSKIGDKFADLRFIP